MDYKFRVRSRDWTEFDEEAFADQMSQAYRDGKTPEEFMEEVGMTREEITEYMEHRMDTDPLVMMTMYHVALLTDFGFTWVESGYMIEHLAEFGEWLTANYDGPEMEFPDRVVDSDQEEQIEYLTEVLQEDEEALHALGVVVILMQMGLSTEKAGYIVCHRDEFIEWVRANYVFPTDPDSFL